MSLTRGFENRLVRRSLAVVILVACLVNYPCLIWGLQSGGDRDVHLTYLIAFDEQLRAGDFYPQWLNSLNYGAGSPIFFVQYPLPYYISAALHRILFLPSTPEGYNHALGLFMYFSGILSSIFAWLWCRRIAGAFAGLFAALVALTMPYAYGFDLYYRAAIGEYWALAWIPLALYFAHDLHDRRLRGLLGVAVAYAAILLAHPFSALLFAPFLIAYAICVNEPLARYRAAVLSASAAGLGMALSAFYFFPMMAHRLDFNMANLLRLHTGNFYYQHQLFPFGQTLFPGFRLRWTLYTIGCIAFGAIIIGIGVLRSLIRNQTLVWKLCVVALIITILAVCLAPLFHFIGFQPHPEQADANVVSIRGRVFLLTFATLEIGLLAFVCVREAAAPLPSFLAASCLFCFFLTTRWSEAIWHHIKLLWNLQFPWRLDGLLTIFSVGLVALVLRDLAGLLPRLRVRLLMFCFGVWLVFCVGLDLSLGIAKVFVHPMPAALASGIEIGFPTYTNVAQLPTESELGPADGISGGASLVSGQGSASLALVTPRRKILSADCSEPCTILVRQLYYPYWKAQEAGHPDISLSQSSRAGLCELSLSPGSHSIQIQLSRGRPEVVGIWVSASSLVAVVSLLGLYFVKKHPTQPRPPGA